MEDLAPSSSSRDNDQNEKKIAPSSTTQLPSTGSATGGIGNFYTFLISSSVFWVFLRLGLPRLLNFFNSNSTHRSPSPPPASATADASPPYDVCLSCHGSAVKKTLVSTIYYFIESKGLRVLFDKEEFEAADGLHPAIERAISGAYVQIPVFSRQYVESSDCLDELWLMLKSGAKIIPVFYDIRPSDLRRIGKWKGLVADAFAKHENSRRFSKQRLHGWKAALRRVSEMHGLEVNGPEFQRDLGKILRSIMDTVLETVEDKALVRLSEDRVGLEEAMQDFHNFMQSEQQNKNEAVKFVGIVGVGGSGKTSLAKQFYNLQRSSFDRSSFLLNVRHASVQQKLQSKLLKDLFDIDEGNIGSVNEGRGILRNGLRSSAPRVLIVLDGIDHESQVEDLLAEVVLVSGSLILFTSRDEGAIGRHSGAASVYKMKPLNAEHARELFCRHAFEQPHPKTGFEDFVEKFSDKCERLPLFLKVMGAFLRCNGSGRRDIWQEELDYMPHEYHEYHKYILKITYDSLPREEKHMFLDVACFLVGENISMAIRAWKRSAAAGFPNSVRNLLSKCLIEVDDGDRLIMHDHVRDFGREIANEEPPFRFWHSDQISQILEPSKGKMVWGLMAATATSEYGDCLTCNQMAFEKMELSRLRHLVIKGDCFQSRFGQLSTDLAWLRWYDCPHTNIPSWLTSKEYLTVLQLIGGNLEEWQVCDKQLPLKELGIQNTRLSEISIPQDVCPNLEHLDLSCNYGLKEVQQLPTTLVVLKLENCKILKRISGNFRRKKLKMLNIRGCCELQELPDLKHLSSLQTLDVRDCTKLQNLKGLEHLLNLQKLDIIR